MPPFSQEILPKLKRWGTSLLALIIREHIDKLQGEARRLGFRNGYEDGHSSGYKKGFEEGQLMEYI